MHGDEDAKYVEEGVALNTVNKELYTTEDKLLSIVTNIEYKLGIIMAHDYTLASNRLISDDEYMLRKKNAKDKILQSFDKTGELSFSDLFIDKNELDKIQLRASYLAETGILNRSFSETILKAVGLFSKEVESSEVLEVFKEINDGLEPLYQEAMKEVRKTARS